MVGCSSWSTSTVSRDTSGLESWPNGASPSNTTHRSFWFPSRCTRLAACVSCSAPGVEFEEGSSGQFAWRTGMGWDFPVGGNFLLTPGVNADLVNGDWNFTYGVQLGYGFWSPSRDAGGGRAGE